MSRSSSALWDRITALLLEVALQARGDARVRRLECDERAALLSVEWSTLDKSPLYAHFDRGTSTVVLSLGEHQSISDYEVTDENLQWYADIIAAVVRGGWAQEYLRLAGISVGSRAVLDLPRGPTSFHDGLPWIHRRARVDRVRRYHPWN